MMVMFYVLFSEELCCCVVFLSAVCSSESAVGLKGFFKKITYEGLSIKCRLRFFSFKITPTYEGLSYIKKRLHLPLLSWEATCRGISRTPYGD